MAYEKSVTAILSAKDNGFTSSFKKAQSLLETFSSGSKKAGGSSQGLGSALKSVVGGMSIYNLGAKAVAQATQSVSSAMSRADTLYLFKRNMTEVTGSTQEASKYLNELSEKTTGTAYALDSVANSTQSFASSNIEVGKSLQYSGRFMDLISRYGDGTNETFKRVTMQMNQMAAKGKANLGDINSALEAGIPVWKILSDATGKSMGEMRDYVESGKMTAEEFFDAMMKGSKNVEGIAKDGAKTWSGAIGIMKSRFTLGMTDILNSIQKLGEGITGDKFGIYQGIVSIGTGARTVLGGIGKQIEGLTPFFQILSNSFKQVFPPMKQAVKSVGDELSIMWSGFSKTDVLTAFSSAVGFVSDKLVQFSGFVKNNASEIASLTKVIPPLLASFMTLKTISSVSQSFANFGLSITNAVIPAFEKLSVVNQIVSSYLVQPVISGTSRVISALSNTGKGFLGFNSNLFKSISQIRQFDSSGSLLKDTFRGIDSALSLSNNKLSQFTLALLHPISSINSLKGNLMMLSAQAGGSGTVMSGIGIKIGTAFRSMATTGIGAIRSLSVAMLSNPITAILLGITATIAFVTASWSSNFMNIQGVVSSFGNNIKSSLTSLGSMFKGMESVTQPLINGLKMLGVVLTGSVMLGIGLVVDGIRMLVLAFTTAIKSVQALGKGFEGLGKAMKFDFKGAKKSFDEMGSTFKSIGNDMDTFVKKSAMKGAVSSLKEFGKETQNTAKTSQESIKEIMNATDNLNAKITQMNSEFKMSFETEGQTDGVKKYVADATSIMDNFYKDRDALSKQYNDLMTQAEQAKGKERVALEQQANDLILNSKQSSQASMLALAQEFSSQLKNNKNVEGQELTAEQRNAMQQQLEVIREGLMQQNELYIQASQQKLALGQQLSAKEQQATISNMQTLYATQTEQMQANEEKIAELKKQYEEAKTESQKMYAQQQIDELGVTNEQLLAKHQEYGANMLEILANGNELNAQTVLQGLELRKDITDEQLGLIVQSFNQSNNSVGESLSLLAGIMQQKGFEGSTQLAEALRSQDLSVLGGELSQQMISGINALPSGMFAKGNEGKAQLITALNQGDITGVLATLSGNVIQGLNPLPNQMGNVGTQSGTQFGTGLSNTKGNAQSSGTQVGDGAYQGAKSKAPLFDPLGMSMGTKLSTALGNTKGQANSSGVSVANGAYDGANSRTSDFHSVGYNMGRGVASGLNDSVGEVTAAANRIVAEAERAANAKAKIKSPSRLFRVVGNYMGQGIAVGIDSAQSYVKQSMGNMIMQAEKVANDFDVAKNMVKSSFSSNSTLKIDDNMSKQENRLDELLKAFKEGSSIFLDGKTLVGYADKQLATNQGNYKRREFGSWQAQ